MTATGILDQEKGIYKLKTKVTKQKEVKHLSNEMSYSMRRTYFYWSYEEKVYKDEKCVI